MPAPADPSPRADERLTRLLGFGEHSVSKSYYPELRRRLEELERFRSLLDQTGDAIFLVDVATGRIADAAGAAGAMLRLERGDLVTGCAMDRIHAHDQIRACSKISQQGVIVNPMPRLALANQLLPAGQGIFLNHIGQVVQWLL